MAVINNRTLRSASFHKNPFSNQTPMPSGCSSVVRYILVPEHPFLLYQLPDFSGQADEVVCLVKDASSLPGCLPFKGKIFAGDPAQQETYQCA